MSVNGKLPQSDLAPIPGGYLRKDAAAAWNAMNAESKRVYGIELRPKGSQSSYRPYADQVYWRDYWCNLGKCANAAVPGTSNHGWGLAVDVDDTVRWVIDQIGRKYGWAKEWSDAPWEPWHLSWRAGVWQGTDPGAGGNSWPTLRKGTKGQPVARAQRHLSRWNQGLVKPDDDGDFGATTRRAVVQFQTVQGLTADGVIGPATWKRLRSKDRLPKGERGHVNRLRWFRRSPEARRKNSKRISFHRQWIASRLKNLATKGRKFKGAKRKAYWSKNNRASRRIVLRKTLGRKD